MLIFTPGALGAVDQTTSYQIDPTHNGVLTGFDLPLPLEHRWSATFAGPVVTPLVVNGVVYAASQAGAGVRPMVHALRQDSGETLWTAAFGDSPTGLTYDRGRIFALDSEGTLTAFDARTGDIAWSVVVPGQHSFSSPPTASGGIVYTTGNGYGKRLFATDESSGALLWSAGGFEGGSESTPTVDGGKVYLTYPSSYVAFDSWSGTAVWSPVTGNAGGGGTAAVSANGHIYIRDWSGPGESSMRSPARCRVRSRLSPRPSSTRARPSSSSASTGPQGRSCASPTTASAIGIGPSPATEDSSPRRLSWATFSSSAPPSATCMPSTP